MTPIPFYLARRLPSIAALNAVLFADALRWAAPGVVSVYSPAFRQAMHNARHFHQRTRPHEP